MYRFILELTEEEKLHRRELLNSYANIAQISTLVPLIVLQTFYFLSWLTRPSRDEETFGSPRRKSRGLSGRLGARCDDLRVLGRKIGWWFVEPVVLGGESLGLRGQLAFAGVWGAWLLTLCFLNTGEDYLHLTKRFGIVAASQLPIHYPLSVKSPYSPIQFLTRQSHETLNTFHQLLGRIILLLFTLHATFYLNFFIQKEILLSKLTQAYVLCGIAAISGLWALGSTALAPIRRWNYRVFYTVHVIVAVSLLPVLFFHVSHLRIYLYETAVVVAANFALRWADTQRIVATIKKLPEVDLVEITVPRFSKPMGQRLRSWQPGQHGYISLASESGTLSKANPFSLASIPTSDSTLRFVARILTGNTAYLGHVATANPESDVHAVSRDVKLEGPYGVRTHADELLLCSKVLFIAGGIGATFIVPLYRQLLADLSLSSGSSRRRNVEFLWVVRGLEDVRWAFPAGEDSDDDGGAREGRLGLMRDDFVERLKVYVTGSARQDFGSAENGHKDGGDGIEMEQRVSLLQKSLEDVDEKRPQDLMVTRGRPDLGRAIGDLFSHPQERRVAVVVCGPQGLNRAVRKEVRSWGLKGRNVWYHEEEFAL